MWRDVSGDCGERCWVSVGGARKRCQVSVEGEVWERCRRVCGLPSHFPTPSDALLYTSPPTNTLFHNLDPHSPHTLFHTGAYSPEVQGVQRTPCDITGAHVNYI